MNLIHNFNSNEPYTKLYDSAVPVLEKLLTPSEFKFTICLMQHVSPEDNILRVTSDPSSKILSLKELSLLHGLKYDFVRKTISLLKRNGVIEKHKIRDVIPDYTGRYGTAYTINPAIFSKG